MLVVLLGALAVLIALLTAAIEILSRYRDEPFRVFRESPWFTYGYVLVNGVLGCIVFACLRLARGDASSQQLLNDALLAGFGTAIMIRSRIFTTRVGDQEVSIGPGFVVDRLLAILDRQIDRQRAMSRTQLVRRIMHGKDFDKMHAYAAIMINDGLQNLTNQEREELAARVQRIAERKWAGLDVSPQCKSYALGFLILDFMGEVHLHDLFGNADDRQFDFDSPPQARDREEALEAEALKRERLIQEVLTGVEPNVAFAALRRLLQDRATQITTTHRDSLEATLREIEQSPAAPQEKTFRLGFAVVDFLGERFVNEELRKALAGAPAGPTSPEDRTQ